MNDREQWSSIERIFHGALERKSGDRADYLARECAGDESLRKRVESLLESDDQTSPVDSPVLTWDVERTVGHYRLVSKLGEGGMGVVYLARDLRLDRDVAVKVLKPGLIGDREGKRRLLAEAKAVSALNHPNIVTLHDAGAEGDVNFLVMEYVAGKPLDQLIPRNGLKIKEALHYAMQIADALATAHATGIVHRDLKPGNVLITEKCVAKVVDFGIAKHMRPEQDTGTLTQRGLIFGTVAYMSPEQAEGKTVDARSDIFSFGSLLYEMATGHHPFRRDTAASTVAAVLRDEPESPMQVADDVPPQLADVIEKCLRKEAAARFQRMAEVRHALEAAYSSPSRAVGERPIGRRSVLVAVALGLAVIGSITAALWYMKTAAAPEPALKAVPLTTYRGFESTPSFSPDGGQVAFSWCKHEYETPPVWQVAFKNFCNIYITQIGVEPPFRLTETETKDFSPAWSPNGNWIAFLRMPSPRRLALVLVPQRGGREKVLQEFDLTSGDAGDMPQGPHLSWTPDSQWVVCPTPGRRHWYLSLVSISSSETRVLTNPSAATPADTAPAVSPDGRTLAFSRAVGTIGYELYTLRLSEQYKPVGEPARLPATPAVGLGAAWLPDGSGIVFASELRGADGLWRAFSSGSGTRQRLPFAPASASEPAVSRRGHRLAYTAYREDTNIWRVELTGRNRRPSAPALLISSTRFDEGPAVSPDGRKIAFMSERSGTWEVWLCDRDGSNPEQLTSLGGIAIHGPQWSPDARNIAVTMWRKEDISIGIVSVPSGAVRVLSIPGGAKWPSWSKDGRTLYFASDHPSAIGKIDASGGVPVRLTRGPGEDMPQSSPDGKFIYYNKGWPGPLEVWRIDTNGGAETKVIEGVATTGQWIVGPDGIYFFTVPDAKGVSEIRMYEFATGTTRKIMNVERGVMFRIAVSPDGRTILYPQVDEQGSDLMLIENFR